MELLSVEEYVRRLGLGTGGDAADIGCEVCGGGASSTVRDSVAADSGSRVRMRVVACDTCGFLFQNPRFGARFYEAYYARRYRPLLTGGAVPDDEFIEDQISRGLHLLRSLAPWLRAPGRLLDVGCSSGGMLAAFLHHGWQGFGTDPDAGYVEYGIRALRAPIVAQPAEAMRLEPRAYDLVVIAGSLEHVVDPNRVLALCRAASAPGALLVLEGRGLAQARQTGSCGHNHRRYLTATSIPLLMRKHGWEPLCVTEAELCGPTRPQSVFGIGRASDAISPAGLRALIAAGQREPVSATRERFDAWAIA